MPNISRFTLYVSRDELDAIEEASKKGEFVTGKELNRFEKQLSALFQKDYCIATVNGFSALLLSILATGIKNKNILLPAVSTCFAMSNAIKATANTPVFADIQKESGNICPESARNVYSKFGFELIISPNHFGIPSDIFSLKKIGVPIIEDAAQSFFSNITTKTNADFLILSFYPTKMINAIDGGAILTEKLEYGKFLKDKYTYRHQLLPDDQMRFNFQMPNIHAAVGLASLKAISNIQKKYNYIKAQYSKVIEEHKEVMFLGQTNSNNIILKQFILKFNNNELANRFIAVMNQKGIACSKELLALTALKYNYPNAYELFNTTCTIPMYEKLNDNEINYVAKTVSNTLKNLCP